MKLGVPTKGSHCCLMGQLNNDPNEHDPPVLPCERYNAVGAPRGKDDGYCFDCGHDRGCHA